MEARYVKVTYQLSGGAFCWASEISAYGEAREPEVPQESEPVSHEKGAVFGAGLTALILLLM